MTTTLLPSVPQYFVEVDRDKVLSQGVDLGQVYGTLQAFMGGQFVNYFNRFGREWQVYVEAEGDYRTDVKLLGQFYVRNSNGDPVPLAAVTKIERRTGPEFTMRYNLFRSAQINATAAPGYSSAQAMTALEEVFAQTMPSGMGFDYLGMSFQEQKAQQGVPPAAVFALSLLFVFLILAALYESWSLPLSVLLGTPIAVFGSLRGALAARDAVQHLCPDRPDRPDRPRGEERHPDRRIRQGRTRKGERPAGCGADRCAAPASADPDDLLCLHPRLPAAGHRQRRRRLRPGGDGDRRHRRHACGDGHRHISDPHDVLRHRQVSANAKSPARRARATPAENPRSRRHPGREAGNMRRIVALALLSLILGGCMVGPDYRRPAVETPQAWRFEEKAARDLVDTLWWEQFNDPVLNGLIGTALRESKDLKIATARLEEFRGRYDLARAALFPQVGAGASAGQQRVTEFGQVPLPSTATNPVELYQGSLFASWEIDLWGKLRRGTEAARANLLGTEEERRGVILSLVASVAGAYVNLRNLDRQLEIARRYGDEPCPGPSNIHAPLSGGIRLRT